MKIKSFVFSPFMENTFVIWDNSTMTGAVVDPGMYDVSEQKQFDDFIAESQINLKYIINTHCHIDHIFGVKYLQDKYQIEYWAPEGDIELIEMAEVQAGMFALDIDKPDKPNKLLKEESFFIANVKGEFIFTPGHTPGELCIYFPDEKICITGDVLFKEGIGRTDLWGGNYNTLMNSIKNKLLVLPEETIIYPGHGDSSTIGYEKKHNSFLN